MTRRVTLVAAIVGAFFALAMIRVVLEARSEFSDGEEELAKHDLDRAITHYRRAIQWYLPANPYVERAVGRLVELAQRAESTGNGALALRAWRDLRGALYSVRSFYQPYSEQIRAAERRIAKLMAALPPTTSRPTTSRPTTSRPTTSRPTTSQPTTSQRTANRLLRRENESTSTLEAKYLRQLQRDYAPSPWWSALMVLGFIGWVGSAFSMIVVGFDSDGRLIARKAWPWAGAIVAGLALWMIALRLA